MNVVLVNQYFPPDTSATARVFAALSQELTARGHSVRVVAGRPSYQPEAAYAWRLLRRLDRAPLTVERVGSTAFRRNNLAGRISNYVSFLVLGAIRCLFLRKPDVVIAGTDPPLSVLVALLAAKGSPVLYSLQDLHPDVAVEAGWMRRGPLTALWDRLHVWAAKRCWRVVCLDERMRHRLAVKGIPDGRLEVVPNGAEPPASDPDPETIRTLRDGAALVAIHAGNLGAAGAWDTLLAAREGLGPGTRMLFVGEGAEAERLKAHGAEVVPFLPASQLSSVMAAGDLQIVTMKRGMEGLVVPSKLYSILAHGRPVLAVVPKDCEVAQLVRDADCGWVADPGDPGEVIRAIEEARTHPDKLDAAAAASAEAGKRFDRSRCMAALADIIENA